MLNICDDWDFERKLEAFLAEWSIGRRVMTSAVRVSKMGEAVHEAVVPTTASLGDQIKITNDAIRCGIATQATAQGFVLTPQGYRAACQMAS